MITGRNPGRMDRRIALWYPIVTRTETGGVVESFAATTSIPAGFLPIRGAEFQSADAKQANLPATFSIRYRADVTETWRVYFSGQIYELISPPVLVDRNRYLDLYCSLLPDQNAGTQYPSGQSFIVDLAEGDESKDIVFPAMFAGVPAGLAVQLLIPDGGFTFPADPVFPSLTATGFTVDFGAAVPADGYKLSIQAAL